MTDLRTSGTKVALYHTETGQRIERWPVDAREILQRGEYALTPVGEPEITDIEAGLRMSAPAAAPQFDAALITDEVPRSPVGVPLAVVHEGVMTTAGDPLPAVAKPKGK
jgi:hypothetical protein